MLVKKVRLVCSAVCESKRPVCICKDLNKNMFSFKNDLQKTTNKPGAVYDVFILVHKGEYTVCSSSLSIRCDLATLYFRNKK